VSLLYFDTSALIKRYVREVGSERVDALLIQESVAVSSLVQVEVASALARRTREGRLNSERRDELYARFLDDLSDLAVVDLDEGVSARAADQARTSPPNAPLRALDAIHLASALVIFEASPPEDGSAGTFVTSDRQLQRADEQAGLRVLDPEA
jgi:hypothetical protein